MSSTMGLVNRTPPQQWRFIKVRICTKYYHVTSICNAPRVGMRSGRFWVIWSNFRDVRVTFWTCLRALGRLKLLWSTFVRFFRTLWSLNVLRVTAEAVWVLLGRSGYVGEDFGSFRFDMGRRFWTGSWILGLFDVSRFGSFKNRHVTIIDCLIAICVCNVQFMHFESLSQQFVLILGRLAQFWIV